MSFRALQWLAIGSLAVSITACNREEPVVTQTETPAQQTSVQRDDSWIETSVQSRFYGDDAVRGRTVSVDANGGVVTLRGTVENESARQQAVTLARGVEGVTSVNDELQVGATPASTMAEAGPRAEPADTIGTVGRETERTPVWITTKIQAQYFINPEIKPWNIDVTTNSEGVVVLEGAVEEAADKTEAVRIARETDGVTRVEDRLRIETAGSGTATDREATKPAGTGLDSPDGWVTAKIQAKYFTDGDVKGRNINVNTSNGVVTLNGTVESEAQRRQAVALARTTDGVQNVNDQLTVAPAAARPASGADPGGMQGAQRQADRAVPDLPRPDVWVTTKIQSKYFLDTNVKGRQINVDTRNGIVTLKGNVETAQQKAEAEQIARETEGVKRVVNQLIVDGKQ